MMKNYSKLMFVLIISSIFFAFACANQETPNPVQPDDIKTYKSVGIIKSIDPDGGKITLDHEDIPGYMGAMEMTEAVSDAKMLESFKAGDKVEFEIQRTNAKLLITSLTKIGEVATLNGGEIYKTNCTECHGGLGEGAPKGVSLLKGHALNHSEKEYVEQVTNGEGKKMPAFKDKLSAEQISSVVKFVREELQKDITPEERAKYKH